MLSKIGSVVYTQYREGVQNIAAGFSFSKSRPLLDRIKLIVLGCLKFIWIDRLYEKFYGVEFTANFLNVGDKTFNEVEIDEIKRVEIPDVKEEKQSEIRRHENEPIQVNQPIDMIHRKVKSPNCCKITACAVMSMATLVLIIPSLPSTISSGDLASVMVSTSKIALETIAMSTIQVAYFPISITSTIVVATASTLNQYLYPICLLSGCLLALEALGRCLDSENKNEHRNTRNHSDRSVGKTSSNNSSNHNSSNLFSSVNSTPNSHNHNSLSETKKADDEEKRNRDIHTQMHLKNQRFAATSGAFTSASTQMHLNNQRFAAGSGAFTSAPQNNITNGTRFTAGSGIFTPK